MSDQPPTTEQLWAQYDSLAPNPIERARFALAVRLFETARPNTPAPTPAPVDTTGEDPRIAEYETLRQINPVAAARFALERRIFEK